MSKPKPIPPVKSTDRPQTSLGASPEITNEDQANEALREIGFLSAHAAAVDAATNAEIDRVLAEAKAQLVLEIEGEAVDYKTRAETLAKAIDEWSAKSHPKLKSANGPKSIALVHGQIGWKKSTRDKIEFAKGCCEKDVITAIDKLACELNGKGTGFIEQMQKALARILILDGEKKLKADAFVDLVFKFSKSRALAALNDKTLTKTDLRKMKTKLEQGADEFFVKANAFDLSNKE